MTQPSEKLDYASLLREKKKAYRQRVWAAPATPSGAKVFIFTMPYVGFFLPLQVSQDISSIASPFPAAKRPKPEPKECARCNQDIPFKTDCRRRQLVECDGCHSTWHLGCAKLTFPPKAGSRHGFLWKFWYENMPDIILGLLQLP